jgi:LysR family transcriptional regulator, repressor for citA
MQNVYSKSYNYKIHKVSPYAKQLLSIHESAISRLKALELFKDTLNISAVHSIYDYHVQNIILKYMQKNKRIAIKVTIEHSEELIQMLHDGICCKEVS